MSTNSASLATAVEHHQAGELDQAERMYHQVLQKEPEQADALHLLGVIAHQTGRNDVAVEKIRRAIAANPRAASFHSNLGLAYRGLKEYDKAVASYERALEIDAGFVAAHSNLGNVLKDQGKLDEAAASFRRALEIDPRDVKAHNNLAVLLECQGKLKKALAGYERSLEIDPQSADTLGNLAALCERCDHLPEVASALSRALKAHPDHPHLNLVAARLEEQEGRLQEAIDRLQRVGPSAESDVELSGKISFLLAQLYDRTGDTAGAFSEAVEANCLTMRSTDGWYAGRQRYLQVIDVLSEVFTETWVGSWKAAPPLDPGRTPVFLIGFPRSGATLLDAMLDGHPRIRTLEEKPAVFRVQKALENELGGYPRGLADLGPAEIEELRATYFGAADASIERKPGDLLLDKLPLNMVNTGLILRLFPAAKFIMAVRHPYDACLSCLMQNFKINFATANFFTLEDAAELYRKVTDLYQQYMRVLPHPCHVVRYEDLVDDFEAQTRRVLEFLGVDWDDAVLDYREHARRRGMIRTLSYNQVVQPIYTRSRYRWQRYAEQLAPVIDELKPYVELFGYQS